jgi:trimeric autotransporter adhesin
MVAEGVDVTTIIAKQMEKIEELTLYVVALKKENDIQKIRNKRLETRLSQLEKSRLAGNTSRK